MEDDKNSHNIRTDIICATILFAASMAVLAFTRNGDVQAFASFITLFMGSVCFVVSAVVGRLTSLWLLGSAKMFYNILVALVAATVVLAMSSIWISL